LPHRVQRHRVEAEGRGSEETGAMIGAYGGPRTG